MSSKLAFSIFGAGYGGFSAGTAFLAFMVNGKKMLYKSTLCEGTSTSIAYSVEPFEIKNDSGGESPLFCLQGFPVKLQIGSAFINPIGDYGEFTLEIRSPNKSEPIYKTSRTPTLGGFSASGISIIATFAYIDISPQMNMYGNMMEGDGPKWDEVWNGKLN